MVCLYCTNKTSTVNSRLQKKSNSVWRRRKCLNCGTVFTTIETSAYDLSIRVKSSSGKLTPFSRDKLFMSLHKSLGHRKSSLEDSARLADTVISQIYRLDKFASLTTGDMKQIIGICLNRFDKAAYTHYQANHSS